MKNIDEEEKNKRRTREITNIWNRHTVKPHIPRYYKLGYTTTN